MKSNPIASGWLITLGGPPLGLLTFLLLISGLGIVDMSYGSWTRREVTGALFMAYVFGGLQSIVAGIVISYEIYKRGWVALENWLIFALLLGIVPCVFRIFPMHTSPNSWAQPLSLSEILVRYFFAFFIPTLAAALVLRILLIWFGWMRRPAERS